MLKEGLQKLGRKIWLRMDLPAAKDLDFQTRLEIATSEWKKAEEGELGMNWFESGHDSIVGVVMAAISWGPDVAAYAVKKGFARLSGYSPEQKAETIRNLNYQGAVEGWNNPKLKAPEPGDNYRKVQLYKI